MDSESSHALLDDLNPVERDFYRRFRLVYEAYNKAAWELEELVVEAKKRKGTAQGDGAGIAQTHANQALGEWLQKIQELVQEGIRTFPKIKKFGADLVGSGGLTQTLQRRIEREVLAYDDPNFIHTLQTAIINMFVEREKVTRASIYKKRFRGGFRNTAESVIQAEQKKNADWRKELLDTYTPRLSPSDLELIQNAFMLRMARHGQVVL